MAHKAPGKHYRKGLTLIELARMSPITQRQSAGSSKRAGPTACTARAVAH